MITFVTAEPEQMVELSGDTTRDEVGEVQITGVGSCKTLPQVNPFETEAVTVPPAYRVLSVNVTDQTPPETVAVAAAVSAKFLYNGQPSI